MEQQNKQYFTGDRQRLAASNKMVFDGPICRIHLEPHAFHLIADGLRYGFIFRSLAEANTAQEEGDPLSSNFHMGDEI